MMRMPVTATLDRVRDVALSRPTKRGEVPRLRPGRPVAAWSLSAVVALPPQLQAKEFLPAIVKPSRVFDEAADPLTDELCHDAECQSSEDVIWMFEDIALRLAQHCRIISSCHHDYLTFQVVDFSRSEPHMDPGLCKAVQDLDCNTRGLGRTSRRLVDDVFRDGADLIMKLASKQYISRLDEGHLWSQVLAVIDRLSRAQSMLMKPHSAGVRR